MNLSSVTGSQGSAINLSKLDFKAIFDFKDYVFNEAINLSKLDFKGVTNSNIDFNPLFYKSIQTGF